MSLLVTGSIGIDTVETPHGRAENVLGGSAIYFSIAASLFSPVRVVGVVGEDFSDSLFEPLRSRSIDIDGIERRPGSQTFRWHGRYEGSMNEAATVDVKLNVLGEQGPSIPKKFESSRYVFLANTHPSLQHSFAEQMNHADLIVCDTMNLWIATQREALIRTLKSVSGLVLNEGEARQLTEQSNLVSAGKAILDHGPEFVIIKKGEHGSLLVARDDLFVLPAYPTQRTIDPTGCGDTFAGALMGYLASTNRRDSAALRSAMARGSVVASFVIESFSVQALAGTTRADVESRLSELRRMAEFE